MEYLKFDYRNTKTELTLTNYEKFISSNKFFKFYLFDLMLTRYNVEVSSDIREQAVEYVRIQKILFVVPYAVVSLVFLYKHFSGFFVTKIYIRELKLLRNLIAFTFVWRMMQKGLLKYQVDQIYGGEKIKRFLPIIDKELFDNSKEIGKKL